MENLLYPCYYTRMIYGNRTKKWNCFDAWSLLLAGLPKNLNAQHEHIHLMCAQHEHIHLMCASNRVSAVCQLKPIVDDLLLLQDGMVMFDALWN